MARESQLLRFRIAAYSESCLARATLLQNNCKDYKRSASIYLADSGEIAGNYDSRRLPFPRITGGGGGIGAASSRLPAESCAPMAVPCPARRFAPMTSTGFGGGGRSNWSAAPQPMPLALFKSPSPAAADGGRGGGGNCANGNSSLHLSLASRPCFAIPVSGPCPCPAPSPRKVCS